MTAVIQIKFEYKINVSVLLSLCFQCVDRASINPLWATRSVRSALPTASPTMRGRSPALVKRTISAQMKTLPPWPAHVSFFVCWCVSVCFCGCVFVCVTVSGFDIRLSKKGFSGLYIMFWDFLHNLPIKVSWWNMHIPSLHKHYPMTPMKIKCGPALHIQGKIHILLGHLKALSNFQAIIVCLGPNGQ